jgi:hypothetical protein
MARQQDGSFTLFAANITSLMQAQQLAINTTANADWQANRR